MKRGAISRAMTSRSQPFPKGNKVHCHADPSQTTNGSDRKRYSPSSSEAGSYTKGAMLGPIWSRWLKSPYDRRSYLRSGHRWQRFASTCKSTGSILRTSMLTPSSIVKARKQSLEQIIAAALRPELLPKFKSAYIRENANYSQENRLPV